MAVPLLRTLILYCAVICAVRLMGKRQIGEMELTEFVVTMLLANLAAIPMQDGAIPLYSGLVPILTVLGSELVLSGLILYSVKFRQLLCGKPVILAVNKVDQGRSPDIYEFYNLGLGDPIAVSAVHGHGTGDLLDACVQYFPPEDEEEEEDDAIKVAVIGKPNAGKSSLVNKILGEERVIVSNVAGTTRDAIDSCFTNDKGSFVFIDTAGMRKKSKIEEDIEKYSVLRATMAIDRADVCLIMIDATEGVTEQDTKVAGMAHEAGKASIIVVNKWDLVEKDDKTMARMTEEIRRDLAYMTYTPILFISAKTGQRVDKLFDMIDYVANQAAFRVTTGMLNTVLADAQTRVQPPTDKGRRLKIYYMTQVGVKPPHFVVFCNDRRLFHFSYQRYLENCIRSTFNLEGTPIILSIREKGDKED